MQHQSKLIKRLRRFLSAVFALYLGFSLVGTLIYFWFNPSSSRVELFKVLFELSLWLAIPVTICVILLKAWRLVMLAIMLSAVFAVVYVPYLIPRDPTIDQNLPQLKIMTFNTKATSQGLDEIIRSAGADFVALQELSLAGASTVTELDDMYPYQALHPQEDPHEGQGILSRYPITADDYWEYPDLPHTLGHQRVEIDVNGILLAIYNTHPWPPLAWESNFNDESHRVVVRDIADRTFAEELPLLLMGDFNMTTVFEEYELLNTQFTDSFRVAGDGIGYTFPNDKYNPLSRILRLDYIWHSDHFEAVSSTVWEQHGESDHSPVVSILAMKATEDQ